MVLRKAAAYSRKLSLPYTRKSGKKRKAFIKSVPHSKIVKFRFGSQADFAEGKHPFVVKLVTNETVHIRDTALEACRMYAHKMMEEGAPGQYYLNVKVYPHHMLRENKISSGAAGADRTSTGMTQSFGVVIGRAGIVKGGKEIVVISCSNEKAAKVARDALASVKSKVPGNTSVVFERIN